MTPEEWNDIWNYPAHHKYAVKVLINLVDLVLEMDPDAIIILQADHGLHMQTEEQIAEGLGREDAKIDIWNNVFSAIRVPERYAEPKVQNVMKDPRNISRWLINQFVGPNYDYLSVN